MLLGAIQHFKRRGLVQQMKCKLEEVDSDSQSPQKSWEETSLGGLREGQREVVLRDPAANHSGML